ncbi:MAG TPA: helix-turn-helix domain-containing protein [Actinomycetota bacterium]|jgi:hypothetical protein|nr:helix-turn-helix domain-containing protein [Actinomycetota bacterium]
MRSREEVALVLGLARQGLNDCEIARRTGIPRGTVRDWRACDALGIEWRPHNRWSLSVARRGSVALLDQFVGPKR